MPRRKSPDSKPRSLGEELERSEKMLKHCMDRLEGCLDAAKDPDISAKERRILEERATEYENAIPRIERDIATCRAAIARRGGRGIDA